MLVLPFSALGEGRPLAEMLRDALAEEIARTPGHHVVAGSAVAAAGKRAEACAGDDACLARSARVAGATHVVIGGVAGAEGAYRLAMRLLDASTGATVRGPLSFSVAGPELELLPAMRDAARALVAVTGMLLVRTSVPGASVQVDGRPVGTTPLDVPITGLPEGRHTVEVLHPEFRPFRAQVNVHANQTARVEVVLERAGSAHTKNAAVRTPAAPSPRPRSRRALVWGAVGAAALGAIAAGVAISASADGGGGTRTEPSGLPPRSTLGDGTSPW